MTGQYRRQRRTWLLAIGVLLLATVLAWHDLAAHEVLGRDENATITKLDQPSLAAVLRVVPMKVTGQPGNMQPLYFVLQAYVWPLVGRSAFMLRFLPAAFGILAVAATYKLGEALLDREAGLVGSLLTALLPLHVQYSQIARPYTLLALLSLLSAWCLVRAWTTDRPIYWAGFALTGALNFYNHYNGLFVLAAEALFAGIAWLARLAAALRAQRAAGGQERLAPPHLIGPVAGFLMLGVLCAPGRAQLAGLPWTGLGGAEPGAAVAVELGPAFLVRFLDKIGLDSPWLRGVILALIALGLTATLARRRWHAALLAVLWIAVPLGLLAIIKSPRPFVERYVIFLPPVALLLAGEGVATLGRGLGSLAGRARLPAWLRPAAVAVLAAALALLFVAPLCSYYATNRAADRLDQMVAVVERHARSGDAVVVSPRVLVRPLAANGADVYYLTQHLSADELDALAASHQRLWLLFSSYLPPAELQEPLDGWYQQHQDQFARVPIKAITAVAYRNVALADPAANLQDRIAVLEELAVSGEKGEAWLRYGALADTCQVLSDWYAVQGEPELAADYQARAEAARAVAPPP